MVATDLHHKAEATTVPTTATQPTDPSPALHSGEWIYSKEEGYLLIWVVSRAMFPLEREDWDAEQESNLHKDTQSIRGTQGVHSGFLDLEKIREISPNFLACQWLKKDLKEQLSLCKSGKYIWLFVIKPQYQVDYHWGIVVGICGKTRSRCCHLAATSSGILGSKGFPWDWLTLSPHNCLNPNYSTEKRNVTKFFPTAKRSLFQM